MTLRNKGVSLRNTRGCKNRTLIDVVCLGIREVTFILSDSVVCQFVCALLLIAVIVIEIC